MIKKLLKMKIRNSINILYKHILYNFRYILLKYSVFKNNELKIILGAATTYQKGWLSTNEQWFDIRYENNWKKLFKKKGLISNLMAEHVFEHLTYDELDNTLNHANHYLKKGGKLRFAVPDGYNPSEEYIKNVNINGIGADAQDHKQLLNIDILNKLLIRNNFSCNILEGYKNNELIQNKFNDFDGFIIRTRKRKNINLDPDWFFDDSGTSLIVDAIKK
jgi:predicted SAM-dependent methyltransferase